MDHERLYRAACKHLTRNRHKVRRHQTTGDVRFTLVDGEVKTDDEIFELAWGKEVLDLIRDQRDGSDGGGTQIA